MRAMISGVVLAALLAGAVAAKGPPVRGSDVPPMPPTPAPPLDDKRIPISTLVREDLFAGFLDRDPVRMARGKASIESLLVSRPDDKPGLLAWKGGIMLFDASVAREQGKKGEYKKLYKQAIAILDEADRTQAKPGDGTREAVEGASTLLFADRLQPADRKAVWERSYANYQKVYAGQKAFADKLPPHLRGELMSGVTMTAQRTGRQVEADAALEQMLVLVKGTPYEATAVAWKAADAKGRDTMMMSCKNCHDSARLAPVMASQANKGA